MVGTKGFPTTYSTRTQTYKPKHHTNMYQSDICFDIVRHHFAAGHGPCLSLFRQEGTCSAQLEASGPIETPRFAIMLYCWLPLVNHVCPTLTFKPSTHWQSREQQQSHIKLSRFRRPWAARVCVCVFPVNPICGNSNEHTRNLKKGYSVDATQEVGQRYGCTPTPFLLRNRTATVHTTMTKTVYMYISGTR